MKKRIIALLILSVITSALLFGCGNKGENSQSTPAATTDSQDASTYDNINVNQNKYNTTLKREKVIVSDETLKAVTDLLNGKDYSKDDVIDLSAISLDADKDSGFDTLMKHLKDNIISYDRDSMKITVLINVKYEISYDDQKIQIKATTKTINK